MNKECKKGKKEKKKKENKEQAEEEKDAFYCYQYVRRKSEKVV